MYHRALFLIIFLFVFTFGSNSVFADEGWRISQIQYDSDNDGTIDDTATFTYNSDGNYLRKEDADPRWSNSITYFSYDSQGRKETKEIDRDRNGTVDEVEFYSYDTSGYMVERTKDYGGYSSKTIIDYDGHGNVISKSSYPYDNSTLGNLSSQVFYHYDLNNYTYDSNNKPIKIEDDYNAGGEIDSVMYYTYNSFGFVERKEVDNSDDGTIDYTYLSEFDAGGNWTSFQSVGGWSTQFSYDTAPQTRINNAFDFDPWSIWEDTAIGPDYFEDM